MAIHKFSPEKNHPASFHEQASRAQTGVLREFWDLLLYYKLWWLTPIILMLLLVGALVALGGTAAAPFIYTLF